MTRSATSRVAARSRPPYEMTFGIFAKSSAMRYCVRSSATAAGCASASRCMGDAASPPSRARFDCTSGGNWCGSPTSTNTDPRRSGGTDEGSVI